MYRPHKSKLPTVSTPTSPTELVRKFKPLPHGDIRALAASSATIALTIASEFYRGGDKDWQSVFGAAKMTVETAKEFSNMFLPLKAVAGAIFVLIKDYDVGVSCLYLNPSSFVFHFLSSNHRTM